MKLIGYAIGYLNTNGVISHDYYEATARINLSGEVFIARVDAELILKAEMLKAPQLTYRIVEIRGEELPPEENL